MRVIVASGLACACLAARAEADDRPFARSAWLEEASRHVPVSAGVLPSGALLRRAPVGRAFAREVTGLVRVNRDLLDLADATAQSEAQAEPYVAVDPADPRHLVAGYQSGRFNDGGARALGYAVSFDGGATWRDGLIPRTTAATGGPWQRTSDPWVAFGPDGRAYFAGLVFDQSAPDNAVVVSASDDGGLTWGEPVEVTRTIQPFNDKEAIVVDVSPSSPYVGVVYAAWDVVTGSNGVFRERLVVARSTDGGRSWSGPVRLRSGSVNVGAIPRIAPDGTVHVVWTGSTASGRNAIFASRSEDGGATWSRPKRVAALRSLGTQDFRAGEEIQSFDLDPASGDMFVVWSDRRWTGVDQATMSTSRDGGRTWSAPLRVSDGPDDAPVFTPAIACRDGRVAVSYYSLQNDPARRFLADVYIRASTDGGVTFGPSERVTPESVDGLDAARAGGALFFGDYQGLAAASDGAVHLVFVAPILPSRLDPSRAQPDVFAARRTPDLTAGAAAPPRRSPLR